MKFLSLLLTLFLVWTAAAAVIQDREPKGAAVAAKDPKKSTGGTSQAKTPTTGNTPAKAPEKAPAKAAGKKPNKHQAELIMAAQKGAPKYTIPKPPAKGKKVTKRSDETVEATRTIQRRADGVADLNDIATATAGKEVSTTGLATCVGVIVTFGKVSPGKVDKIVAHMGAFGGQKAIDKMTKAIYNAAVEDGPWDMDVDEDHRPQIHVLWPNVNGEVQDMVKNDVTGSVDAAKLTKALNDVVSNTGKELEKVRTLLKGKIFEKTRTQVTAGGGSMKATGTGQVTADGQPF